MKDVYETKRQTEVKKGRIDWSGLWKVSSLTYQDLLPLEDVLLWKLSSRASGSIYCVPAQIRFSCSCCSSSTDLVALDNFNLEISTWTWSWNFIIYSFICCLCLNEEDEKKRKEKQKNDHSLSQLYNRSCVAEKNICREAEQKLLTNRPVKVLGFECIINLVCESRTSKIV